jgi:molecular chaperone GrpE
MSGAPSTEPTPWPEEDDDRSIADPPASPGANRPPDEVPHDDAEVPDTVPGSFEPSAPLGAEGSGEHVEIEDDEEDDPVRWKAERDEYLDALRRLQADFDNFRKRATRQQSEFLERATEGLLTRLLPVLDACVLAVAHVGSTPSKEAGSDGTAGAGGRSSATMDGAGEPEGHAASSLRQIVTLLEDVLAKEGLEIITPLGTRFDPNEADAVARVPADGGDAALASQREDPAVPGAPVTEPGTVVEVLRPGYRLKGKVLRPALVAVSE